MKADLNALKQAQLDALKLVDDLNSGPPDPRFPTRIKQTEAAYKKWLTELMDTWIESGCRFRNWKHAARIEADVKRKEMWLGQDNDGPVRPFYVFDTTVRIRKPYAATEAFFNFIKGPCYASVQRCARCRQFYLNTSGHSDKKYCTRKCAMNVSAAKSMRERREEEYAKKIAALKQAIAKLNRVSTAERHALKSNLRGWLSQQSGLTRHFVSRAINAGEVDIPFGFAN